MAADTYIVHWPAFQWTWQGVQHAAPATVTIETCVPGPAAGIRAEGPFTNAQARQILAERGMVEDPEYTCEFFQP